ncbi:MAG: hypothetical protein M3348_01705 [Acidobacteriota bacterium]|nr:hypothetical protein [Acidobacteriota bacterium]
MEIAVVESGPRGRHTTYEDEQGRVGDAPHRIELRAGLAGGELAEVAAHEAYHVLYSVRGMITADEETEAQVFGQLVARIHAAAKAARSFWTEKRGRLMMAGSVRIEVFGKRRIIRDVRKDDPESFVAYYRGHSIEIGEMAQRGDHEAQRFYLDVRAADGCKVVDTWEYAREFDREALLRVALENILHDERPCEDAGRAASRCCR